MPRWRILRQKRLSLVAFVLLIATAQSAIGHEITCPFSGEKQVLIVQLFLGQNVRGQRSLSQREWNLFLRQSVTPRFPSGFTVYDADGQWMTPLTGRIGREKTKVIVIAMQNTPTARNRIENLVAAYRNRFHQKSVGILTGVGCGAF